jgi:RNA polymerase sigma-70 factor (ECF subfamily)
MYRVAHNVGASHVMKSRRLAARLLDLETLDSGATAFDGETCVNRQVSTNALLDLVYRLKPLDRQIVLLYLEGETAAGIAEVTGLSANNVATKIHRIKRMLKQSYREGVRNVGQ